MYTFEFVTMIITERRKLHQPIWSVKIVTGKTDRKTKMEFMRDKTKWRVGILIYSPFISSGVDYNEVNGNNTRIML
jgi:hypothetical protein